MFYRTSTAIPRHDTPHSLGARPGHHT